MTSEQPPAPTLILSPFAEDIRVDALKPLAILTDTHIRLVFAPSRAEARVVALDNEVRATRIEKLGLQMQQGFVHIQFKAGFEKERHIALRPAEMFLLYEMLDRFMQELPVVDKKV